MKVFLLFDVGGTNIRGGISVNGRIVDKVIYRNTRDIRGIDDFVEVIGDIGRELLADEGLVFPKDVSVIGIGFPGVVEDGKVLYAPNLLYLNGYDIKQRIESAFMLDVVVENDADMICYGEYKFGAGKGVDNFVLITLGTGVGGGVVIGQKLLKSGKMSAVELGHIVIDYNGKLCPCGNRGWFEQYVGTKGLLDIYKKHYFTVYGDIAPSVSPKDIYIMAKSGDKVAINTFLEYGRFLGIGIKNIINIFSPDIIAIGGGISNAFSLFYDAMLSEIKNRGLLHLSKTIIKKAQLKDMAGFYGIMSIISEKLVS